jgi:hypothetical protein
MFTTVDGDSFEVKATDEKTSHLVEKYGDNFGLTDENQDLFNTLFFLPELMETIDKKTGLRSN